jgi:hypothetical protein
MPLTTSDSFHPCGEPVFFFKLLGDNINNNEMSFCATVDPLIKFHFPLYRLTPAQIETLQDKVKLTEDQVLLRRNMLREVPVSEHFIHAMLAFYILKAEVDYRSDKIKAFKKTHEMPLRVFVSTPGHNNIFFVMEFDLSDLTLSCLEVDPCKPIVYNRVKMNLHQVSLCQWKGAQVPIEDYEAFFSADEKVFQSRVQKLEHNPEFGDHHD